MRLLLDTHILYWWFYDTHRLSTPAVKAIKDADEVLVSAASFWEIAIKVRLGKLKLDFDELVSLTRTNGFRELPVFVRHTFAVSTLPRHHSDPFDRLLVAQAMTEPLHLITADNQLVPYSKLIILV